MNGSKEEINSSLFHKSTNVDHPAIPVVQNVEMKLLLPVKKNQKRLLLGSGEKIMIINLYKSKIQNQPNMKYEVLMESLSKETGIGLRIVKATVSEYKRTKEQKYKKTGTVMSPRKSPSRKKNPPTNNDKINEFGKISIRQKIHEFWFRHEIPTFHKIQQVIMDDPDLPNISQRFLKRLLKGLNFEYFKTTKDSALIEREDIVLWRRDYIKDIRRYRSEGRMIYYIDEMCVNARDCSSNAWTDTEVKSRSPSEGLKIPRAKEKYMIVVHIGSIEGFVEGGLLCFESKNDKMNDDTFYEWFCGVLPRLNDNCIIVIDNASYHSVKKDPIPTMDWNKDNVIEWLLSKNYVIDRPMVMCELMEMVNKIGPLYDKYLIDEEALKTKKVVLRIPPYHSELNPFELAWSVVKNHVKKNKLTDIQKLLNDGVQRVTPDMWADFVSQTIKEEDKLYNIDFISDELLDAELEVMQSTRDTSVFSD
ncbi:uncharacterized protein LOC132943093 [Metopolophium dirhodum]|uniref:uncharacterized protein LOC132943093 n=1 Tax=Metopolophium dirhodum TaxID=44670 RepID=UPI0029905CB3|nr:uncharacterized protein LOC132943093 [Metopolophium dirhodum]